MKCLALAWMPSLQTAAPRAPRPAPPRHKVETLEQHLDI